MQKIFSNKCKKLEMLRNSSKKKILERKKEVD